MKYKVVTILFLTFFIVGCELEGDDGVSGAQGQSGPQGEPGPQGIVGLSCWDLNEDGNKTMPDEDTNSDGVIDVYDCRTIIDLSPTNTLVNSTTQTITNQHCAALTAEHSARYLGLHFGLLLVDIPLCSQSPSRQQEFPPFHRSPYKYAPYLSN